MAYERLTEEDIDNLVSAMLDVTSENPDVAFHLRFTQAQERVLTPDKRYSRSVVQQKNKWSKKLQEAMKAAGVWPGYVPESETEQVAVDMPAPSGPVSMLSDRPPPAPVPAPAEPSQPVAHPSALIAQLYESIRHDLRSDIVQELTGQIEDQVRIQLRATLLSAEELGAGGDIISEPTRREMRERMEVEVSIPRIFVIGLLPEQALILRRKLHDVHVDLRFWKNEANTKLTQYADWADHIFVMANFVSHTHIHAINNYRKKIKYCNGAVSDLERQVRYNLAETVS
jgi:hypothetical protein